MNVNVNPEHYAAAQHGLSSPRLWLEALSSLLPLDLHSADLYCPSMLLEAID